MSDHRDSHSRDIIKGSHRGSVSPRMDRGGSPPPRRGGGGRNRSRSGSRGRAHRSRSFSRSRSHSAGRKYSKRAERSTSRSRGAGGGGGHRAYSKSPDNPEPNKCLGVFGLSLRTTERDLRDVFGRYGPIEECTVVIDAQTGRSRGFAFIYFEAVPDAKAAKESCNGIDIDGRRIRVDFSITQRAHTPTPGIYMGRASSRRSNYGGHNNGYNNYGRRSGGGGGGGYGGGGGGGGRDFRRRDGGGGGGGYGGGGGGRSDFRRGGGGGDRRSPSPYYSSSRNRKRATRSRSYSPSPRGKYY